MGLILNIETATKVCSVAIGKEGNLIDFIEVNDSDYSHSEKLNVFIIELLERNKLTLSNFDAIAISEGPGSYTGLRIGTSTAKGICYSLDIPLISVNTLSELCELAPVETGTKVPMIDARRMEVYTAFYSADNNITTPQHNLIVNEDSFNNLGEVYLFGNGADKFKELFKNNSNINFIDEIICSAKGMVKLSEEKFQAKSFEDVAYFEPNYGKEFYTTAKV